MRRVLRSCFRAGLAACLLAGLALGLGFLWFAQQATRVEADEVAADGIVALTGGAHRINDAAGLLLNGRARRLLITGVNPSTTRAEIARALGGDSGRLVECCVDLDYAALNTVGNAVETAKWARAHRMRSLIVVTSAYHMPRTLAEIRHRLPDVALRPFPVISENVQLDRWWEHPATTRVLAGEYVKYLYAAARRNFGIEEPEPPPTRAALSSLDGARR